MAGKEDDKKLEDDKAKGGEPEVIENDEVEVDVETQAKEAADDFKKQIEALKRSEGEQRERASKAEADRNEALRIAHEREAALTQHQYSAAQSRFEAITSAMAAASTASEAAKKDIASAHANGDAEGLADAYQRLARSEADLSRLSDGKEAAEQEIQQEKQRAQQAAIAMKQRQDAAANDPLARANIPETAKTWLRQHPEFLSDQRKNAKLQALHYDVVDEGYAAYSPEYFDSLERHLGLKAASEAEHTDEDEDVPKKPNVSAPVSRQTPGGTPPKSSVRTLTRAQREAAQAAGITEVEYAKQLDVLKDAKAQGLYNN